MPMDQTSAAVCGNSRAQPAASAAAVKTEQCLLTITSTAWTENPAWATDRGLKETA